MVIVSARHVAYRFVRLRKLMQANRSGVCNTMTKQDNSKPQAGVTASDIAAPPAALGPAPTSGPAAPAAVQGQEAPRERRSRDGLVVASIVIAAIAVTVMCYSQIGLALSVSGAAGIVTLALLMLIHKQTQKSAQIALLKAELAQSRQPTRPRAALRAAPPPSLPASSAEERIRELSRDIGNIVPRSEAAPSDAATAPTAANQIATELAAVRGARKPPRVLAQSGAELTVGPAPNANAAPIAPVPVFGPSSDPVAEAPAAGLQMPTGLQATPAEPVREQWSFRPRTDAQASVQDVSATAGAVDIGAGNGPRGVVATVEGDLELVQRKIKELADEVNAAEALRPRPVRPNTLPRGPSNALEDSIGALRAAAKSMRERPSLGDFIPKFEAQAFAPAQTPAAPPAPMDGLGELVIPTTAERIAGSDATDPAPRPGERDVAPPSLELPLPDFAAPPANELPPRLAEIAQAIDDDTMDILLGPIVTLAEHSVGHYEMSARLRSGAGEHVDFAEDDFPQLGGEFDSRFDIARFNRAAALAARMDARDRDGSLLAEVFGSSMTSRAFLGTFARAYEARKKIAEQLVLTFLQRAVDEFSPSAWQAIRDMHQFGFRMALDQVRHVGTDFAALQRSGFRFVRLDAQVLLEGMTTPERFVPPDEILQRATLAGLSIIAGGIVDAGMQKRLLESGVLLGQGPLFGAARQVNVDGTGSADQSAAA